MTSETQRQELREAASKAPHQTWAAFTDDSGSKPHTNLVAFTTHTECVLSLPGLHKTDPLVRYLWAAQPATITALLDERERMVAALSLVRMSHGWQYMADETREIIDAAHHDGGLRHDPRPGA